VSSVARETTTQTKRYIMSPFPIFFTATLLLIGISLGILALINQLKKKKIGCSGNHDCVVYKGEKVQCPSCDLREFQARTKANNK